MRLFWILVVVGCFIFAAVEINNSFVNWAQSPVSTTIETLPIGEASFPLVTVCPPRDSFTNLNYDLMTVEKKSLSSEEKEELVKFAIDSIQDSEFEESQEEVMSYQHTNRFMDWYSGATLVSLPYLDKTREGSSN